MRFSSTLYSYQSEILNIFEKERVRGDKKIHIVAPPGSGKTIVGLEMMTRLDVPTLILVPNLTLQEQWKDKLEKLFLESHESSIELISTSINEIKKINIVTYQSLSGSDTPDDDINAKILDIWFQSEKDEFKDKETFLLFVSELKSENPDEYRELYGKHRKKLKDSGDSEYTRKLMKGTIHEYIENLRSAGVKLMIVDEAHHLTAWWSYVLHEIWKDLSSPYIVGLTATPPFENVDYFELDESYTELLGTVDYYIPTPAIVKSGRLAPYSDLVYIVPPDTNLSKLLEEKEKKLQEFISLHKTEICIFLHEFLIENFSRLEVKSLDLLEKWMRFIYIYKTESLDMSSYITGNANKPITLEDIAKSIGKWGADGFKKTKTSSLLKEIKELFFDLGYIWRGANLYRFQTPIEKGLIYSKSKIQGVRTILDTEMKNLSDSLRVALISDFLDVESDWINCHFIFDELSQTHRQLNPYLVSGQGIWRIENGIKVVVENESILTVTEKLTKGETKLVIGTRGILGEGWDCPAVNTLIDLTGVSAYMSVNQVHGRAIRLDTNNPNKVANIYDIICLGSGYQGMRDFERLEKKHTQFYGVDDSGLVIKELDHIYPQLERMISNPDKINNYTLKKSTLRGMVQELWGIGGEYKNEEIFSLSIEILKPYEIIPLPKKLSWWQLLNIKPEKWKNENLLELGKSSYHWLMRTWIREILDATLQVMKPYDLIPKDFSYEIKWSDTGSITISSNYKDPLISKKFIETASSIFSPITDEKYVLGGVDGFSSIDTLEKREGILEKKINQSSTIALLFGSIIFSIFSFILSIAFENAIWLFGIVTFPVLLFIIPAVIAKIPFIKEKFIFNKFNTLGVKNITIGLPDIISSNEEKRRWFTGKEYGTIPQNAEWYIQIYNGFNGIFNKIESILVPYNKLSALVGTINPSNKKQIELENGIKYIVMVAIFLIKILAYFIIKIPLVILFGIPSGLLYGIFLIFFWIILQSISLLHIPYIFYTKISNYYRKKSVIQINGSIKPTSQSDIGKPSFLSAKIEKLWI